METTPTNPFRAWMYALAIGSFVLAFVIFIVASAQYIEVPWIAVIVLAALGFLALLAALGSSAAAWKPPAKSDAPTSQ